ncbi:MAG: hypothetical protein AAFN93_27310 [Bacteroidota bacterium]
MKTLETYLGQGHQSTTPVEETNSIPNPISHHLTDNLIDFSHKINDFRIINLSEFHMLKIR